MVLQHFERCSGSPASADVLPLFVVAAKQAQRGDTVTAQLNTNSGQSYNVWTVIKWHLVWSKL